MGLTFVDIVPKRGVPRDGHDRPLIVPKAGGKPVAHRRTTTFIDVIEDKSNLAVYGQRNVLIGAAKDPGVEEVLREVRKLDPEEPADKQALNRMVERLEAISGAHEKRERGTYLHGLSELVDAGTPLPDTATQADLEDMMAYMEATMYMTPIHVEQLVVVNELLTAGTPDRVSAYDGPGPLGVPLKGNLITDLKTGSIEYGSIKMPTQLAIYSRGEVYDHTVFPVDVDDEKAFKAWKQTEFPADLAATAYSPLPEVNQDWGIIIHLTPGTGVCKLHWVDLNEGWDRAKLAQLIHEGRRKSKGMMFAFDDVLTVEQQAEKAEREAAEKAEKAEAQRIARNAAAREKRATAKAQAANLVPPSIEANLTSG